MFVGLGGLGMFNRCEVPAIHRTFCANLGPPNIDKRKSRLSCCLRNRRQLWHQCSNRRSTCPNTAAWLPLHAMSGCSKGCPGRLVQYAPRPNSLRPVRPLRISIRRAAIIKDPLIPLGMDFLTFLASTVLVTPLFKAIRISPIIGFLFTGVILQQCGLIQDLHEIEKLAELGVLFLLFEMGLELSLDRLKALAKYAFGMGTLQMAITTGVFTLFALPAGRSIGTIFLEQVAEASPNLVSIRTLDEAVVIGAALSLSSSAFVLQLMQERGELQTRMGSATLGILLLQDIAVVPFLVLLPLIENGTGMEGKDPMALIKALGPTAAQTVAGLGLLLLGGRFVLRRIFEMVAASRSSETFVALCLLTVAGASLLTQKLGFSDTLGAFIAGVLLSETSFRTQVEADIRPFRGLLLGLFFVTTGSTIDMTVLMAQWPVVTWMLLGLIFIKTSIIVALAPLFGLTRSEAFRTGFLLSQGGEFAFVLLSLANQLNVLPEDLNQILIIVVVLSMALTPGLAALGKAVADQLDSSFPPGGQQLVTAQDIADEAAMTKVEDPVVICGFGPPGQMLANMLQSPLVSGHTAVALQYVAFDLDPARVQASRKAGFTVIFGDGSRKAVLRAAGVKEPRAVVVAYASRGQSTRAVESIRQAYPLVPIYACARDIRHAAELEEAGADNVIISSTQAGLAMGAQLLAGLGASPNDVRYLCKGLEEALNARARQLATRMIEDDGEQRTYETEIFVLDSPVPAESTVDDDNEVLALTELARGPVAQALPPPAAASSVHTAAGAPLNGQQPAGSQQGAAPSPKLPALPLSSVDNGEGR